MKQLRFGMIPICILFVHAGFAQSEAMLTGKITDSLGQNLRGCRVVVCGCDKTDSSDGDGVYRIYVKPGRYELQLFRDSSLLRRRRVEIPEVEFYEVDFKLSKKDFP